MPEPPDSTKEATICRESQMERIGASDQVDLTGWQRDGSFTVKLSSKRLVMPSPGIGFGDLMVFIAVVVIVAVFLAAVRSFIRRVENPDPPAQPARPRPAELHAEKARVTAAQRLTSTKSTSR